MTGLILFVVANFSYQAALIYYDATLRTVSPSLPRAADCPGSGSRWATSARISWWFLLIFLARHPGRGSVPAQRHPLLAVFALPMFLARPQGEPPQPATARGMADLRRLVVWELFRTIEHARDGSRPAAIPLRPIIIFRCRQYRHRGHERRCGEGNGPERGDGERRPAAADVRRDRHELRVGLAGGPARAPSRRSSGSSISWAVGLVLGRRRDRLRPGGPRPVPGRRRDPRQRARRRARSRTGC